MEAHRQKAQSRIPSAMCLCASHTGLEVLAGDAYSFSNPLNLGHKLRILVRPDDELLASDVGALTHGLFWFDDFYQRLPGVPGSAYDR